MIAAVLKEKNKIRIDIFCYVWTFHFIISTVVTDFMSSELISVHNDVKTVSAWGPPGIFLDEFSFKKKEYSNVVCKLVGHNGGGGGQEAARFHASTLISVFVFSFSIFSK